MQNIDLFARKQKNLIFHLFSLVVVNFHSYHPWDKISSYWIKIGIKLYVFIFAIKSGYNYIIENNDMLDWKPTKKLIFTFLVLSRQIFNPHPGGSNNFIGSKIIITVLVLTFTLQNSIELLFVCITLIYLH